jgi:hypothetical protein
MATCSAKSTCPKSAPTSVLAGRAKIGSLCVAVSRSMRFMLRRWARSGPENEIGDWRLRPYFCAKVDEFTQIVQKEGILTRAIQSKAKKLSKMEKLH